MSQIHQNKQVPLPLKSIIGLFKKGSIPKWLFQNICPIIHIKYIP
jgi:hypothetical protein